MICDRMTSGIIAGSSGALVQNVRLLDVQDRVKVN